jgi:hypothetical protein
MLAMDIINQLEILYVLYPLGTQIDNKQIKIEISRNCREFRKKRKKKNSIEKGDKTIKPSCKDYCSPLTRYIVP